METQGGKPWALLSLPPFPAIALRVLQLLDRETVGIKELVELIRSDPVFCSNLLVMANSALFAFRSEIKSIQQATALLGLQRVKALALTVGIKVYLMDAVDIPAVLGSWRHSVACALVAEYLAKVSLLEKEIPYVAGMIHDIGRLAIALVNPQLYAEFLNEAEEAPFDVLQRERELFGIDHCEAGALLVKAWKLPQEFEDVARHHHGHPEPWKFDNLGLVRWSCLMADTLGFAAVRPKSPHTFQDLLECLPERERRRFSSDREQFALKIAMNINALE